MELKKQILPLPEQCIEAFQTLLPELFYEQCSEFLSQVQKSSLCLQREENQSLFEFENYLKHLFDIIKFKKDILFKLVEHVEEWKSCIESVSFTVSDAVLEKYELCKPEFHLFRDQLDKCLYNRELQIQIYRGMLQQERLQLFEEMHENQLQTHAASLFQPSTPCGEALKMLECAQTTSREYVERAQKYKAVQETMNVHKFSSLSPEHANEAEEDQYHLTFHEIDLVDGLIGLKYRLWKSIEDFHIRQEQWTLLNLSELDLSQMKHFIDDVDSIIERASQNIPEFHQLIKYLQERGQHWKKIHWAVMILSSNVFHLRHWKKLFVDKLVDLPSSSLADLDNINCDEHHESLQSKLHFQTLISTKLLNTISLEFLLAQDPLWSQSSELQQLYEEAKIESTMIQSLEELVLFWGQAEIPIVLRSDPLDGGREKNELGDLSHLMLHLEETQVCMQTLMYSSYLDQTSMKAAFVHWKKIFDQVQDVLEKLITCQTYYQRHWLFCQTSEIGRHLSDHQRKIHQLNRVWKRIIDDSVNLCSNNVLAFIQMNGLKSQLIGYIHSMEHIIHVFDMVLDQKRQIFPHFYFLSNEQLLHLLKDGAGNIQTYLHVCFSEASIQSLEYEETTKNSPTEASSSTMKIVALNSNGPAEKIILEDKYRVKMRGSAEIWLSVLSQRLCQHLKRKTKEVTNLLHTTSFETLIEQHYPLQCILLAHQMQLSKHQVSSSFSDSSTRSNSSKSEETVQDKIQCGLDKLQQEGMKNMTHLIFWSTYLVQLFDHRNQLIQNQNHTSPIAKDHCNGDGRFLFNWQENSTASDGLDYIIQFSSCPEYKIPYGFTYLSPSSIRDGVVLQIHPATERYIYFSSWMMQHQSQGCALLSSSNDHQYQTHLTQAFAHYFGKDYFSYQCTASTNGFILKQFIVGVSALQGILSLQSLYKLQPESFQWIMQNLAPSSSLMKSSVSSHTSIFLSIDQDQMPMRDSRQYQQMFRSTTLSSPNHHFYFLEALGKIYGFMYPHELTAILSLHTSSSAYQKYDAKDYLQIIQYASQCLHFLLGASDESFANVSSQQMEWMVLKWKGNLSINRKETEADLLRYACYRLFGSCSNENLPKSDYLPFQSDILLAATACQHIPFQYMIHQSCHLASQLLKPTPSTLNKIILVHGNSKTGKSTLYQWILQAFSSRINAHIFYPQSLTIDQFFGHNGVLSRVFQQIIQHQGRINQYEEDDSNNNMTHLMIFDGSFDPLWLEMLHAATATMTGQTQQPSSEMMMPFTIPPNVHFLFESIHLQHSSPNSLTSLTSLLHCPDSPSSFTEKQPTLGSTSASFSFYEAKLESWIQWMEKEVPLFSNFAASWCRGHFFVSGSDDRVSVIEKMLMSIHSPSCEMQEIQRSSMEYISSFCTLFQSLFLSSCESTREMLLNHEDEDAFKLAFCWSLLWSIGGCVKSGFRSQINTLLLSEFSSVSQAWNHNCEVNLYDQLLDLPEKQFRTIQPTSTLQSNVHHPFEYWIPTLSSVSCQIVGEHVLQQHGCFLVCGEHGVGKTHMLRDFLSRSTSIYKSSTAGAAISKFAAIENSFSIAPTGNGDQEKLESRIRSHMGQTLLAQKMQGNIELEEPAGAQMKKNKTLDFDFKEMLVFHVPMDYATTGEHLWDTLCRIFGPQLKSNIIDPPEAKSILWFLDDLHLPASSSTTSLMNSQSSSPYEVVRALLCSSSEIYLPGSTKPKQIDRLFTLASCHPSDFSSHAFQRLQSHVIPYCLPESTLDQLNEVFTTVFHLYIDGQFESEIRQSVSSLSVASIALWSSLSKCSLRITMHHLFRFGAQFLQKMCADEITTKSMLIGLWQAEAHTCFVAEHLPSITGASTDSKSSIRQQSMQDFQSRIKHFETILSSERPHQNQKLSFDTLPRFTAKSDDESVSCSIPGHHQDWNYIFVSESFVSKTKPNHYYRYKEMIHDEWEDTVKTLRDNLQLMLMQSNQDKNASTSNVDLASLVPEAVRIYCNE